MTKKEQAKNKDQEHPEFDFENYRKSVIAGLIEGKGLTGDEGLLKPLIANFIEGALAAELDNHISEEQVQGIKKTIKP
ncbi:MAG: hypothetical protein DHS20C18_30630 [Saprospiraceae bacterium]|nr:MAG: hypothetical protein DHS20C18_30630 [Saprospiraceae bacterium]